DLLTYSKVKLKLLRDLSLLWVLEKRKSESSAYLLKELNRTPARETVRLFKKVGNRPLKRLPYCCPPKWDGTPTLPDMEGPKPSEPSGTAEGTSSPPKDDEGPTGTKEGPATRCTIKKSLDLILEESCQNTLKRHRVTKAAMLDAEDQSSPIVDLDAKVPSQVMEV
ncbi:hypothetical protein HAX54_040802, partial [Datura stramonium]|nr:hypothetical protein [Datura stramonium]